MLHDALKPSTLHQTGRAGSVERLTVSVRHLPVRARIGVHAHERLDTQGLLLNVELDVPEVSDDSINATFDYERVAILAEELGREHIALIETFATHLARALLADGLVIRAEVEVSKPGALAAGLAVARACVTR